MKVGKKKRKEKQGKRDCRSDLALKKLKDERQDPGILASNKSWRVLDPEGQYYGLYQIIL